VVIRHERGWRICAPRAYRTRILAAEAAADTVLSQIKVCQGGIRLNVPARPENKGDFAMTKLRDIPRVGAPDPELKTSPIFEGPDEELPSLDMELETGGCYYNSVRYPVGQYVAADGEMLHCEERGIWVRKEAPQR
jgi:hypothetical protein